MTFKNLAQRSNAQKWSKRLFVCVCVEKTGSNARRALRPFKQLQLLLDDGRPSFYRADVVLAYIGMDGWMGGWMGREGGRREQHRNLPYRVTTTVKIQGNPLVVPSSIGSSGSPENTGNHLLDS